MTCRSSLKLCLFCRNSRTRAGLCRDLLSLPLSKMAGVQRHHITMTAEANAFMRIDPGVPCRFSLKLCLFCRNSRTRAGLCRDLLSLPLSKMAGMQRHHITMTAEADAFIRIDPGVTCRFSLKLCLFCQNNRTRAEACRGLQPQLGLPLSCRKSRPSGPAALRTDPLQQRRLMPSGSRASRITPTQM